MMPPSGTLADVGHLLFGTILALAVALATCPRFAVMRIVARTQSGVVVVAAGWTAWATGSAALAGLALVVLGGGGVLLPYVLGHADDAALAPGPRPPVALATAALLVVLALLAVLPAHLPAAAPLRLELVFVVAAVLVALFVLATRHGAARLAGLWAVANGVAPAGILVASSCTDVAVAALFAFVAVGALLRPTPV
jgi:hypothetical protein